MRSVDGVHLLQYITFLSLSSKESVIVSVVIHLNAAGKQVEIQAASIHTRSHCSLGPRHTTLICSTAELRGGIVGKIFSDVFVSGWVSCMAWKGEWEWR